MQQLGHQKGEIGLQGNFKHNKVSNANANLRDAVSGITLQLLRTQNERQKKKKKVIARVCRVLVVTKVVYTTV